MFSACMSNRTLCSFFCIKYRTVLFPVPGKCAMFPVCQGEEDGVCQIEDCCMFHVC